MQLAAAPKPMVPIRYIGKKPYKTDNVNHTRTTWNGTGDVQDYPADLVPKLLHLHSDIWAIATDRIKPASNQERNAGGETQPTPPGGEDREATAREALLGTGGRIPAETETTGEAAKPAEAKAVEAKSKRSLE